MIIIFVIFWIGAFAFCCQLWKHIQIIAGGKREKRSDHFWKRTVFALELGLGHQRIMERPWGWAHGILFWTFIIFLTSAAEMLVGCIVPGFSWADLFGAGFHGVLCIMQTYFAWLSLVALAVVSTRRIVSKKTVTNFDAIFILADIFILMISHIVSISSEMALGRISDPAAGWMPIERALSATFADHAEEIGTFARGLHLLLMAVFFVWIPNSKHLHIVMAWPNIWYTGMEWIRGKVLSHRPAPVDFERYEAECEEALDAGSDVLPTIGLRSFEDTTMKQRLEAFSCTLCKRCVWVCPMQECGLAQKNPMDALISLRKLAVAAERHKSTGVALAGEIMENEALWNCTQCGACDRACPMANEHTIRILMMRQNAVAQQDGVPPRLDAMFAKIERSGNPWGYPARERTRYFGEETEAARPPADGGEKNEAGSAPAKIAVFAGCMASYDKPSAAVHTHVVRWLREAGFDVVTLDGETCCGEPLRKAGNELGFITQAQANVRLLEATGADFVISTCPHCAATLNDAYRDFGLRMPALHIVEFWRDLYRSGALKLAPKKSGTVALHMPCYLSKYEDITRDCVEMLQKSGIEVRQTGKATRSLCCGAGGARFFWNEDRSIANTRTAQLAALHADSIGTLCHFCRQMIADSAQNSNPDTFTECVNVVDVLADCAVFQAAFFGGIHGES